MPVTVRETHDSRELNVDNKGATAQFRYFAYRSYNELEVYNAVLATAPLTFQGLVKRACRVKPLGGGFWNGEVNFELPEGIPLVGQGGPGPGPSPDSGGTPSETQSLGTEFNFDTAGGTAHITQSVATKIKKGRGGVIVPDNKGAIGLTRDGKVEGCDIVAPKTEFSFSRRVAFITLKYIRQLVFLTGKVNSTVFLGHQPGELLFLGASGQFRDADGWTVNYKFAAAENEGTETEPLVIVPGELELRPSDRSDGAQWAKLGWEYLWFGYREQVDAGANMSLPLVDYVYLEQVYKTRNFAAYLGWGA